MSAGADYRSAERTVNGLLHVTLGGAQLKAIAGLCQLCTEAGRCLNLVRLEIVEQGPAGAKTAFMARRHCDQQAVFAALPLRPRPAEDMLRLASAPDKVRAIAQVRGAKDDG